MLWETNPRFQMGVDILPVTPGSFMDWQEQPKGAKRGQPTMTLRFTFMNESLGASAFVFTHLDAYFHGVLELVKS
jgi:hypothetical protein